MFSCVDREREGTHFGVCSSSRAGFKHKGWSFKKKKIFKGSIIVLIAQTDKCNERSRWNECRNFIFAEYTKIIYEQ